MPDDAHLFAPVIGGVFGVVVCIAVPLLIVRYYRRRYASASSTETRRTVKLDDLEFGDIYIGSSNQNLDDLSKGPALKIGALPGGKSPGPAAPGPAR